MTVSESRSVLNDTLLGFLVGEIEVKCLCPVKSLMSNPGFGNRVGIGGRLLIEITNALNAFGVAYCVSSEHTELFQRT